MKSLTNEIIKLEPRSTNVAAIPMPMALATDTETASVGHSPKAKTNVGFSLIMPLVNSLIKFFIL